MDRPDLLACQRCTRLKTKCSKDYPSCAQCLKHSTTCVPVPRLRRPRGRNGGRPDEKIELFARIAHLEDIVKSMVEKIPNSPSPEKDDPSHDSLQHVQGRQAESILGPQLSDAQNLYQNSRNHATTPLGQSLFTQLSEELVGIREILDDSSDIDIVSSQEDGEMNDNVPENSNQWLFSESTPDSCQAVPNSAEVSFLLSTFRRRVHPLLKAVHMPKLENEIRSTLVEHQSWSHDAHVGGVHAAAFYVAVASLGEGECRENLGCAQTDLLRRWRTCVEHKLTRSCFLISERLETLQTLIFYLVATRSHDSSRTTWTLLPLAVRIAQALQVHREEHYRSLRPLDAHLRRAIWQCLQTLDLQAAMDRGSDTFITERGNTVKPPMHVDDSEFVSDNQYPLAPTMRLTNMTIFAMSAECGALARLLNFVEPQEMERPPTLLQYDFHARNEAVSRMEDTFKQYLSFCDESDDREVYHDLATMIVATMRLYVVRPLQRHPAMRAPTIMKSSLLQLATETLSSSVDIYNRSQVWVWYGRQFGNWHPLAVLLAELAVQPERPLEWEVAKQGYKELGRNIADGVHGPLWKPITKLMRAAEKRQNMQQLAPDSNATVQVNFNTIQADDINLLLSNMDGDPTWDDFVQPWTYWEDFTDGVARGDYIF